MHIYLGVSTNREFARPGDVVLKRLMLYSQWAFSQMQSKRKSKMMHIEMLHKVQWEYFEEAVFLALEFRGNVQKRNEVCTEVRIVRHTLQRKRRSWAHRGHAVLKHWVDCDWQAGPLGSEWERRKRGDQGLSGSWRAQMYNWVQCTCVQN